MNQTSYKDGLEFLRFDFNDIYWAKWETAEQMHDREERRKTLKIIKPSYEIIDEIDGEKILKKLERCARVCYKSEGLIKEGSAERLLRTIIKAGHESVLEHVSFTVIFVTTRSVTHEFVRHRVASYSQESQRYVDYKDEIEFILPAEIECDVRYYEDTFIDSEKWYKKLRAVGEKPQNARAALDNACATEIVVTANIREWRHIFKLRTDKAAHPDIRALLTPLLHELQCKLPVLFGDIMSYEDIYKGEQE